MFTGTSYKEQDHLNKAKQLKRLAWVIYCGKMDQYVQNLSPIFERIVEALKVPNAPIVYIQVIILHIFIYINKYLRFFFVFRLFFYAFHHQI